MYCKWLKICTFPIFHFRTSTRDPGERVEREIGGDSIFTPIQYLTVSKYIDPSPVQSHLLTIYQILTVKSAI